MKGPAKLGTREKVDPVSVSYKCPTFERVSE